MKFTPIFLCIFLIACKTDERVNNQEYQVLDLDQIITERLEIKDLVDSINFTFLQYNEEYPVGQIRRFKVSDNFIWIADDQQKLFVFKKDGSLVTIIDQKGNGPQEYQNIEDFAVEKDEKSVLVLSPRSGQIIRYNIDGSFQSSHSIPYTRAAHLSHQSTGGYVIYQSARFSEANNNLYLLDKNFNTVDSISDPEGEAVKGLRYLLDVSWYAHSDKTYYKEVMVDTVYEINNAGMKEPHLVIDFQNKRMPNDYYSDTDLYRKNFQKFYLLADIRESEEYIYTWVMIDGENKYLIFPKGNGTQPGKLVAHRSGGINLWPEYIYDETVYRFHDTAEIADNLGSGTIDERLKDIIEDNSNPVLVSAKLRKGVID